MKKIIKLTESELTNFIHQIVTERVTPTKNGRRIQEIEGTENFFNPEALDNAEAIYTIVVTTISLLGIAGYDILRDYVKSLRKSGKNDEASEMQDAIREFKSNKNR